MEQLYVYLSSCDSALAHTHAQRAGSADKREAFELARQARRTHRVRSAGVSEAERYERARFGRTPHWSAPPAVVVGASMTLGTELPLCPTRADEAVPSCPFEFRNSSGVNAPMSASLYIGKELKRIYTEQSFRS